MDFLEKDLLNLQHSLFLTKGTSFLGFGVIGSFSFYSVAKEFIIEKNLILLISLIWFSIFGALSINEFSKCNQIQNKVKKEYLKNLKNKKSLQ